MDKREQKAGREGQEVPGRDKPDQFPPGDGTPNQQDPGDANPGRQVLDDEERKEWAPGYDGSL